MIATSQKKPENPEKLWSLEFLRSPLKVESAGSRLKALFAINELEGDRVKPVGEEVRECDIFFRSVGYQGRRLFPELPWDESRSVIPNVDGKVKEGMFSVY